MYQQSSTTDVHVVESTEKCNPIYRLSILLDLLHTISYTKIAPQWVGVLLYQLIDTTHHSTHHPSHLPYYLHEAST